MQALILAAGMGSRLKELTQGNTKCMVKVNGVSLIERMLRQVEELELSRIVIVVGYRGEQLMEYIDSLGIKTPIEYIHNTIYDKTNNIYSLAMAQEELVKDDTLLLESDLIFEDSILKDLMSDERDTLALVDKYDDWMDGTCLKLDEADNIKDFIPGKAFCEAEKAEYYKTVNAYKLGKEFLQKRYVPFLKAYMEAYGVNEYYEAVLKIIIQLDNPMIQAKRLQNQTWYEIDNETDLRKAEQLFL